MGLCREFCTWDAFEHSQIDVFSAGIRIANESYFTFFFSFFCRFYHVQRTEELFHGLCVICLWSVSLSQSSTSSRWAALPQTTCLHKLNKQSPMALPWFCTCTMVIPWYTDAITGFVSGLDPLVHYFTSHSLIRRLKSIISPALRCLFIFPVGLRWKKRLVPMNQCRLESGLLVTAL